MTAIDIDLRDLPADVQDILRDRAIRESRPMQSVMKDYVLESARLILAAASPKISEQATLYQNFPAPSGIADSKRQLGEEEGESEANPPLEDSAGKTLPKI